MEIFIEKNAPTQKFNHHWRFCVGSPHATYALRKDWTEQLRLVRDELGIERVRFHGIFCDDMHTYHKATDLFPIPGGGSYTEQSFRMCAVAYDNILSAGMKPFVELSFMPKHLAKKNTRGMFFYKPNISPPKSSYEWGEYIKSFIRFLIDRYGEEEIKTWYFEVWNEPDLRMPFFAGTQKDYFELYKATVRAIKYINPDIKVGGPSTSGSKWVTEFLEYCRKNSLPVDFITTHQYAGDPLGGIDGSREKAKININPFAALGRKKPDDNSVLSVFRKLMATDKVYGALKKDNLLKSARNAKIQAGVHPLFYTEWNLCASFSAECNDTRMVAAYDVHSILNTSDTIDGSSIWCFTDLFEELHPFPEEFHGGFGMLTQSGIRKPIFHALKFLNEAGNNRIRISSCESDADVAVFKNENSLYIISTLPVLDINEKKAEEICINIQSDIEPKNVSVKKIDENHGNPLRSWQKMGSPAVPNFTQLQKISKESEVISEEMPYSYSSGKIKVEYTLQENDVWLIKLEF